MKIQQNIVSRSWLAVFCLGIVYLVYPPQLFAAVTTPIGTAGLAGYWPLENDWHDAMGGHDLMPTAAGGFSPAPYVGGTTDLGYGPTHLATGNGAQSADFTSLDRSQGVTLEGWFFVPDNTSAGRLIGFGKEWTDPKLVATIAWGFLWINVGKMNAGVNLQYPRYGDLCWHHLAVVLAPPGQQDAPIRVYVDGTEVVPLQVDGDFSPAAIDAAQLFGAPFRIGEFESTDGTSSGGNMRVDEMRVWTRALGADEIAQLSHASGTGARCEGPPPPDWSPVQQRCTFPQPRPKPVLDMGVRVLDNRNVVVIADPNPWLKSRVNSDCGVFLTALEAHRAELPDWLYFNEYDAAIRETLLYYRPAVFAALDNPAHYRVGRVGAPLQTPVDAGVWPQAVREFHFPSLAAGGSELHTYSAEVVYFSYLTLAEDLQPGETYRVQDTWGYKPSFLYDPNRTLSWAIKTNQLGYSPVAVEKYAYLGGWLGAVRGALDVRRFEGQPFDVVRNQDKTVAFTGKLDFRADDRSVDGSGEWVYQADFSPLTTPGNYFIRIPGVGRSRTFTIGKNPLGEAFYIHARGLYHQRCGTDLTAPYTAWQRSDNHTVTRQAAFPPASEDYTDHSAEGWGFLDANGHFPAKNFSAFELIGYTATDTVVPGVKGGWHDAADYDRDEGHMKISRDLAHAYLMFPRNFRDGQLNLPESQNGVPDILDEAAWGIEVWRLAQQADGRVATRIEATSHPHESNPGKDTQPYYLSLATHNSSLSYAASAALVGRALVKAGDVARGQSYIKSARRAYAYGVGNGPRVMMSFQADDGATYTWREAPTVDARRKFYATVQLWLATGDPAYRKVVGSAAMVQAFQGELAALYWRTNSYDLADIVLAPTRFPSGWAIQATQAVVNNAADWLGRQAKSPYRKLWYTPGEGYFPLMAWGQNGFTPILHLVAAWRYSGEERFHTGALLAVDWMHGGNPQNQVGTTGLGQYNMVSPLHLPSDVDGILDPVPGITLYAYTGGIPFGARQAVYGLFDDPDPGLQFAGSALAQLPSPWNDTGLSLNAIGDLLYGNIPLWRRMVALEATNVPQSEFTVTETIGPAAAVTGALMGPGWQPSTALKARGPRSIKQWRESLWYLP
ncbi:hypothetical protein CCP3SC5AM1_60008 [Gammaproteobacteria bacterium]